MKELTLRRKSIIAAVTLLVTVLVLYTLIFKPFAAEGAEYTAEFGAAGQGLNTTSPVKVRGMEIGRIHAIELLPSGRARVTLRMNQGVRIPDTAVASLEPASVFGPKFINLLPGEHESTGPYLKPGSRIERTTDLRDLSDMLADVNAVLADLDPTEIAIIVNTLAEALGGQGQDLRETLESVEKLVQVAHKNRKNAQTFLHDLARLASIRGAGEDIGSIVADTNTLVDAAANGDGRLRRFSANLASISALTAHGFNKHGGDLREGFRSAERAIGVIDAQLGLLGPGIRTINDLLPLYKELTWPQAKDHRALAIQASIPANVCAMLVGACPDSATAGTKKGAK